MAVEGTEQAQIAIKKIQPNVLKAIRDVFAAESVSMATHIKARHMTGGTTEDRLKVRSGKLRASVRSLRNQIVGDTISGGVGIGTEYARVHVGPKDQETVIKPKSKKWLTVPLPAAQTAAGVLRGSARSGMWGETFIRPCKKDGGKSLVLYGKRIVQRGAKAGTTRDQIVPLFWLTKQVTVKARVHPEDILAWEKPRMMKAMEAIGVKLKP